MPAAIESHPSWVLWPTPYPSHTENGLLSLFTGLNWQGSPEYLQFQGRGREWNGLGYQSLVSNGYLSAKTSFLGGIHTWVLPDKVGNSSESALLLALTAGSSTVPEVNWNSARGAQGIVIYQAHEWDDAVLAARRCGGKAIVLEFPPEAPYRWSRFWKFGTWQQDPALPSSTKLRVEGVIEAKDLMLTLIPSSLVRPEPVRWTSASSRPKPLLEWMGTVAPAIRAMILGFVFLILTVGVWLVKTERNSAVFRGFALLAMGSPAIDLMAGSWSSSVGYSAWSILIPFLVICSFGALSLASMIGRRRTTRFDIRLQTVCVLGLVAFLSCDSVHGDYSTVLSGSVSNLDTGFVAAYLLGVLIPIRVWAWRLVITGVVIVSLVSRAGPWAGYSDWAVAPIALISLLPPTWYSLIGLAILPLSFVSRFDHFSWTPFGLLASSRDLTGFDLSGAALNVLSLPLAACALVGSSLAVSSIGFGQHRLVQVFKNSQICGSLAILSTYFLGSSIFIPGMFSSAIAVVLGCALVLVYTATAPAS